MHAFRAKEGRSSTGRVARRDSKGGRNPEARIRGKARARSPHRWRSVMGDTKRTGRSQDERPHAQKQASADKRPTAKQRSHGARAATSELATGLTNVRSRSPATAPLTGSVCQALRLG